MYYVVRIRHHYIAFLQFDAPIIIIFRQICKISPVVMGLSASVYVRASVHVCVCVCMCARARSRACVLDCAVPA